MELNTIKKISSLLFFSITCMLTMQAQTFYVASNGNNGSAGTISAPWKTIQYAVDKANAGAVINVRSGTYKEIVTFSGNADSGTLNAKVTLQTYNGETVIIDGASLSPGNDRKGLISISGASHITVKGFVLQNFKSSGGGTPVGILVDGTSTNISLINNTIRYIQNTTTCSGCSEGAHGIAVFGTTTTGITNFQAIGNEVYNCVLQSSEAFVLNGNVNGFLLEDNNVHDNNNIGFDFIGYEGECGSCNDASDRVRNGIVRNNISKNNRSDLNNPWYNGDQSAGGFYVDGGTDIIFEGNVSTGNNLGFEFASEHRGKSTSNITVRNNFIYANTELGISLGGYQASLGTSENIKVINNTFYRNKGWGTEIVFQYNIKNCQIANNIVYSASGAAPFEDYNSGSSGNTWSNNLYYGGSGAGPGSVSTANPLLVNPANGNLRLQASSPAINKGKDLGESIRGAVDIDGNPRTQGTSIDIGAHEFTSDIPPETINAPSNLVANAVSTTAIALSWKDNASNETNMMVERSDNNGSTWSIIATLGTNVVSYTSTGLTPNMSYSYRVNAKNATETSTYSNTATAKTNSSSTDNSIAIVDVTASFYQNPNTPEATLDKDFSTRWSAQGHGVTITYDLGAVYDLSSVKIAFYQGNTRYSYFDVQTSVDGGTFPTVLTNQTSSSTTNALENFDIQGKARYVRMIGNGNTKNDWTSYTEVEIWGKKSNTEPPVIVNAPSDLTVNAESSNEIVLHWKDNAANEANVMIERSVNNGDWTVIATLAADSVSYINTGLMANTSYSYRVNAKNSQATSLYSNIATAITKPTSQPGSITVVDVMASTYQNPNTPEATLDKDYNTRWSAQGHGVTITYDLGAIYDLSSVKIAFYQGNTRYSYFDVKISVDGVAFPTVLTNLTSSSTTLALENFAIQGKARYVRIVGNGNAKNDWTSYTEVEIWGVKSSVGVMRKDSNKKLSVYPLPGKNVVTLNGLTNNDKTIEILNLTGEKIKEFKNKEMKSSMQIDVADIQEGVYIVKINGDKSRRFVKIIINRRE